MIPVPALLRSPATCPPAMGGVPARRRHGFTLLEVMIAMALLLVGGVSILAVFTLAVAHRVHRGIEGQLDQVRPQVRVMAQEAVDRAPKGKAPAAIVNAQTAQTGFTVSISFVPSPNADPAWVALVRIAYQGTELSDGVFPPLFVQRNVYDRPR